MKRTDKFINAIVIRNDRGMGLGKEKIIEEIKNSDLTPIHKKGLLNFVMCAEDNRDSLTGILKEYQKNITYNHNRFSRVAMFEKVSFEQFKKDILNCGNFTRCISDEKILQIYESIELPKRSTSGSAGYDFYIPYDLSLSPGSTKLIPTGIRCCMLENWVLKIYPRSGLGFKFRLQLNNTVGIIDSDYYNSDNEGHIMAKITNDSNEDRTLNLKAGTGFIQGVFSEYGITFDDEASGIRNGGFGSTDKQSKNV